jgi:hypothetical protein
MNLTCTCGSENIDPNTTTHAITCEMYEFYQPIGILENVETSSYNGVWKLWKWGSLGLFAIFVAAFVDAAFTLRRIEKRR